MRDLKLNSKNKRRYSKNPDFLTRLEYWAPNTDYIFKECWLFAGKLNHDGYARAKFNNKSYYIHRLTYEWFNDVQIPADLELDHLCKVRSCINPRHLELVTHTENIKRGRAVKDFCIRGHKLIENEYLTKKGRRCLECKRLYSRKEYRLTKLNTIGKLAI